MECVCLVEKTGEEKRLDGPCKVGRRKIGERQCEPKIR